MLRQNREWGGPTILSDTFRKVSVQIFRKLAKEQNPRIILFGLVITRLQVNTLFVIFRLYLIHSTSPFVFLPRFYRFFCDGLLGRSSAWCSSPHAEASLKWSGWIGTFGLEEKPSFSGFVIWPRFAFLDWHEMVKRRCLYSHNESSNLAANQSRQAAGRKNREIFTYPRSYLRRWRYYSNDDLSRRSYSSFSRWKFEFVGSAMESDPIWRCHNQCWIQRANLHFFPRVFAELQFCPAASLLRFGKFSANSRLLRLFYILLLGWQFALYWCHVFYVSACSKMCSPSGPVLLLWLIFWLS